MNEYILFLENLFLIFNNSEAQRVIFKLENELPVCFAKHFINSY